MSIKPVCQMCPPDGLLLMRITPLHYTLHSAAAALLARAHLEIGDELAFVVYPLEARCEERREIVRVEDSESERGGESLIGSHQLVKLLEDVAELGRSSCKVEEKSCDLCP